MLQHSSLTVAFLPFFTAPTSAGCKRLEQEHFHIS
jgi:hypothetical protein